MVIDHLGVVVRCLEDGIRQWEEMFGYTRRSSIVTNTRQMVRVVFLTKQGSITIKLLEPSAPDSPVSAYARRGGGLHHICFRCAELTEGLAELKAKGARLIVPPQPGEAFRNRDIAFVLAENNLNIEVIDTAEKEGWTTGEAGSWCDPDQELMEACSISKGES